MPKELPTFVLASYSKRLFQVVYRTDPSMGRDHTARLQHAVLYTAEEARRECRDDERVAPALGEINWRR